MQKYNFLKHFKIPVNKEMIKGPSEAMAKNKDTNEVAEPSENEMYIPQYSSGSNSFRDFLLSSNIDEDKQSNKNTNYRYFGNRRYVGKDRRKKSNTPKEITLSKSPPHTTVVRRITNEVDSQAGSDEEKLDSVVQYCCELLLVGNRRTRVVQRKQKVKTNRRT